MKKNLKYTIASPIIPLLITILTSKYFNYLNDTAFKIVFYILLILIVIYLVIEFFEITHKLLERRKWKAQLQHKCIYEKIIHNWHITEKGDFFQRSTYTIKNISQTPILYLPEETGLFFRKLKNQKLVLTSLDNSKSIVSLKNFFLENIYPYLQFKKTYNLGWSIKVSPPLEKNETFSFEQKIDAYGTEIDAFKKLGTSAGIPANIPIKQVHLTYNAPPTYKFEIIEPLVIAKFDGTIFNKIPKGITQPSLNSSKTVLTWKLNNLEGLTRYGFKYKIIKEN